ncbi:hypothetical protein ACH61_03196 [Rathayibacter tanaceti]|uniref:Uncharacterized protein n=1 Tax=Rathayibacter tanaceti TaxID=1671680 RepID=A0A162GE58_9MICO|nr:hypothetical protein ACH61_03196 [Rathayibacter tanaceti]
MPRAEPEQERVGVAPAAVHLHGQVEAARPHPLGEVLDDACVLSLAVADALRDGQDLDVGDRRSDATEQDPVRGRSQERDLGPRIRRRERVDGGEGE